jgi:hypothetical protein
MQVRSPLAFISWAISDRVLGVGSGSEAATQGLEWAGAELLEAPLVRLQLSLIAAELMSVAQRGASSGGRELGLADPQLELERRIRARGRRIHEAERGPGLGVGRRRLAREQASEAARRDRGAHKDPDRGDQPNVRARKAVEAEWLAHRRRSIAARLGVSRLAFQPHAVSCSLA